MTTRPSGQHHQRHGEGSNGEAVEQGRLAVWGCGDRAALVVLDRSRCTRYRPAAAVVLSGRQAGPERVIDQLRFGPVVSICPAFIPRRGPTTPWNSRIRPFWLDEVADMSNPFRCDTARERARDREFRPLHALVEIAPAVTPAPLNEDTPVGHRGLSSSREANGQGKG